MTFKTKISKNYSSGNSIFSITRSFLLGILFILPLLGFSQKQDSLQKPLIPKDKIELLKNINITFDVRMGFQAYTFRGGDNYYNGLQFQNGFTALGISGKLHEKVFFNFRNRFNKNSDVQTLDRLGSNIELAYVEVKAAPKLDLLMGKMTAFYGGYEYEFSALDILEYNDIYGNALAFVTGAGITYQAWDDHKFGFQVLNSRTMHYDDLYGDIAAENVQEPDWPVAFVGNWRGSFFDGKLQTIYSASHSIEVKDRGTTFFTLGHKYENRNLVLMYDFHYSFEQIDTKGIITSIISDEEVAENVEYIENWLRVEYKFSPKFKGLLTLMTSSAYDNVKTSKDYIRTSYGMIPTLYYTPFKNIDFRFYAAYIGRYFDYSNFAEQELGVTSYNKNEFRIGIIAPLHLL
ncbi:phosphate-selective porin O/P [Christiangramia gaetbulicola]|uniref:Phosphate-selective porin O/P n=1 Tax=Christiangramia gaetbulicola TaxID=703340 RepID=A0A2T6AI49_9FLAO|nr:porin [Christiangramia gaetbulicola]PTX43493.1 phosphate-selective porin O/P [Christiangramia gaetbulicola]